MTKLTITIAPVEFSAQGVTSAFDLSTAAPIAIEGIIAYGVRRWMQDYVNSQAHVFKLAKEEAGKAIALAVAEGREPPAPFNDGKPFDAAACIAQRIEQAVSGEIRARGESGPSFTPEQDALYEALVHADTRKAIAALAKAWTACKGMTSAERKTAMLEAHAALPAKQRDALSAMAADAIAQRAKLAALLA